MALLWRWLRLALRPSAPEHKSLDMRKQFSVFTRFDTAVVPCSPLMACALKQRFRGRDYTLMHFNGKLYFYESPKLRAESILELERQTGLRALYA